MNITNAENAKNRYILGISLLEQGSPELIRLLPVVCIHEATILGGQTVIYDHLFPLTKPVEVEMENTWVDKHMK